jgi:cation:H+ antiporter
MVWVYFIAIATVIIFAGSRLSIFADQLADLLKLSRSAVGILLVSIVTTLPELSTTLGAIIKVGQPNLALGNNLGSVLFNLMIIAACDLMFRKGGILRQTSHQVAPMAQALLIIVGMLLTLVIDNHVNLAGFNFNIGSVLVIVAYIVIFFSTHRDGATDTVVLSEQEKLTEELSSDEQTATTTLPKALTGFLLCALVVVVCGIQLAGLGDQIAKETGLAQSFVGTLFLAIATSLPELTVGITAVRIGAYDLMIGNVAGANMLNILVIAIADLIHKDAALNIPKNLSSSQIISGGCAIVATLVVMGAMKQKEKTRIGFGWESLVMIGIYLSSLAALYFGCGS